VGTNNPDGVTNTSSVCIRRQLFLSTAVGQLSAWLSTGSDSEAEAATEAKSKFTTG